MLLLLLQGLLLQSLLRGLLLLLLLGGQVCLPLTLWVEATAGCWDCPAAAAWVQVSQLQAAAA